MEKVDFHRKRIVWEGVIDYPAGTAKLSSGHGRVVERGKEKSSPRRSLRHQPCLIPSCGAQQVRPFPFWGER